MSSTSPAPSGKAVAPLRELELSVIGSLLQDDAGRAEALTVLQADMFLDLPERTVYETINAMVVAGAYIDPVTVLDELRHRGLLEKSGGAETLGVAIEGVPRIDGAVEYAKRLARTTQKRRVIHALTKAASDLAHGEQTDVDAGILYDRISKACGLVEAEKLYLTMKELMSSFEPDAHKGKNSQEGRPKSGLVDLDYSIDLFKPSNFTVIAARPAVGKSTLLRQMATTVSENGPVAIFSLEEANDVVRDKMICARARVPYDTFYRGLTDGEQESKLMAAAAGLYDLPIYFYGGYSCDAARVKLVVRSMIERGVKPAAVFVDHLQLMRHGRAESRDQAVGDTTRELRLAALEFGVPIILLCQMNRAIDQRGSDDKRPRLSDLRESGNIEANAVNVMFLWRESNDPSEHAAITLTLAKHRDGPTTEFKMLLDKEQGTFRCVQPYDQLGGQK
jgi:replicative DNA helicase